MVRVICVRKVTRQQFKHWPMRALDSNNDLWAWPRVQTNTSAIAAENTSRSRYRTSVHEESSIKLTKNTSIRPVLRKIECSATWFSHVRKAGSHATLRTHIKWTIYSVRYSLLLLYTLGSIYMLVTVIFCPGYCCNVCMVWFNVSCDWIML